MTSIRQTERGNDREQQQRRRQQSSTGPRRTIVVVTAAAILVCLSPFRFQPALASSKHVPNHPSASSSSSTSSARTSSAFTKRSNRGGFLYPRHSNSNLGSKGIGSPKTAPPQPQKRLSPSPSSTRLRYSGPDENNNSSNNEEDDNQEGLHHSMNPHNGTATLLRGWLLREHNGTATLLREHPRVEEKEDETSRVTTTSFFRLPSETVGQQAPQKLFGELDSDKPLASFPRQSSAPTAVATAAKPPRTQAQIRATLVVSLMGLSGFVEGLCIRRHGAFPNLMTGTILKLAETVGNLQWSLAGIHASMIACYVGGGWVFARWKQNHTQKAASSSEPTKDATTSYARASLTAVSILAGSLWVLSDVAAWVLPQRSFQLPLLALAYGILNAGTVDLGLGVTYAMTGHVTKVGQGLIDPRTCFADGKPHAQSAKGLAAFLGAALLANGACGILELSATAPRLLRLARSVLAGLPLGTTLVVAYAGLFRWYLGASAAAAANEEAAAAAKAKTA